MNTRIGYKLFRVKKSDPGKLFPLFVLSNEPMPIGQWLYAKSGEIKDGKVKSKLGLLKYRPGFHINDIAPYVNHIGVKENGVIKYMHPDTVWCEVEYKTNVDYNMEANSYGWNYDHTKFDPKKACLNRIPIEGFYYYKTSPQMTGRWIISGEMKINRIMNDNEVKTLCQNAGLIALNRHKPLDIIDYGFVS